MQPGSVPDPEFIEIDNAIVPPTPSERLHSEVRIAQTHPGTMLATEAEGRIIAWTSDAVYQVAKQVLRVEALAEQALTETYIQMLATLASYDSNAGPFEQWLLRIAQTIAHHHHRILQNEQSRPQVRFIRDGRVWVVDRIDDPERWASIVSSIAVLSPHLQRLAILRYDDNPSVEQLARDVGRSPLWVQGALKVLRAVLIGAS
jgi:DNA-directed RNA polymerase specialized sigma24 family protein